MSPSPDRVTAGLVMTRNRDEYTGLIAASIAPAHRVSDLMSGFLLVQLLTFLRIPLAVSFAIALPGGLEDPRRLYLCLGLLVVQELSDVLDGYLARQLAVVSRWGQSFDPFADSVSRLIVYWSLATTGLTLAVLPLVMALRDITVAYSRLTMASHGVSVAARLSGKIKAWVQGSGAIFLLLGPLHWSWTGPASLVLASWLVLLVTAASAIDYVAAAFKLRTSSPDYS